MWIYFQSAISISLRAEVKIVVKDDFFKFFLLEMGLLCVFTALSPKKIHSRVTLDIKHSLPLVI